MAEDPGLILIGGDAGDLDVRPVGEAQPLHRDRQSKPPEGRGALLFLQPDRTAKNRVGRQRRREVLQSFRETAEKSAVSLSENKVQIFGVPEPLVGQTKRRSPLKDQPGERPFAGEVVQHQQVDPLLEHQLEMDPLRLSLFLKLPKVDHTLYNILFCIFIQVPGPAGVLCLNTRVTVKRSTGNSISSWPKRKRRGRKSRPP